MTDDECEAAEARRERLGLPEDATEKDCAEAAIQAAEEEAGRRRKRNENAKKAGKILAAIIPVIVMVWVIVDLSSGCTLNGCGEFGECTSSVAGSCTCSGNHIGEFCDHSCNVCGDHGTQSDIEGARAAGSCAGGSCACVETHTGEYCDLDLATCDCSEHGNQTDIDGARGGTPYRGGCPH